MSAIRTRLSTALTVSALAISIMSAAQPTTAAEACEATGCWSAPFSPFGLFDAAAPATIEDSKKFPAASSAVVLPDGRIVYWNGLQDLEGATFPLPFDAGRVDPHSKTSILDLTGSSAAFYPDANAPLGDDMFCSDQRLNQNGTVVVAGGTHWQSEVPIDQDAGPGGLAELYGSDQTHLLDSVNLNNSETGQYTNWSLGDEMEKGRWYPTLVTTSSGDEFVAGGVGKLLWNSSALDDADADDTDEATNPLPQNVLETETYDADADQWTTNDAATNTALPLFARLHLLPNGEIFYGGAGQNWGPAGESIDQMDWNFMKTLDSHNQGAGWRDLGLAQFGARSGTFSNVLPLRPPYNDVEVLMGGGVLGTSPGLYFATNLSEVVKLTKNGDGKYVATSTRTPDMNVSRWYSSSVTLPNGHVVAVSGADKDEVVAPGIEKAIRTAELWNGTEWVPLSDGGRDRTYHNSALLLADGSVLVGGHAPINQLYGPNGSVNDTPFTSNNFKDPSFERLYPPYLFNGARPVIKTAQKHATWGGKLAFTVDGGAPIDKVVLSRLPSVTHTTDADARTVELPFSLDPSNSSQSADIPLNADLLPPGFYYVFGLSAAGTPSIATVVQIADPLDYVGGGGNATPIPVVAQPYR